ncbi:RIN4, pathogenic type III effector avirulence factor Avr cleavage site [Artemisia annua]|uniref:RIN4, pathogenic type III effector avirulence factor Avr cleavage site n=1 Tax=Artemisia annua TaxID=35608 RepID=A0A2U1KG68_ARTAN|nr:RIN4, pathogenic type III effector avirulence factor Avr cleavage site [Artemisia annua]
MAAQEEAVVKNTNNRKSESETPKAETHLNREGDPSKSFDSPAHPKRASTPPHNQTRGGTRSNTASPMWERKVSSDGSHAASSTPGRSRLRQVNLGDESPDDGTAVPVFGDWDDSNPASAEGYSHIFNKVREEKHGGGGKSPRITSNDTTFYGQRADTKKGWCSCFPWGKK